MTTPPRVAWLKSYYAIRAAFSVVWVTAVLTLSDMPAVLHLLLLLYPLWDAGANAVDAHRNGGFARNPSQALNTAVSIAMAIAVALTLRHSLNAVLAAYGVWATLTGVLQLATGVRRRKISNGQWPMILSGAQSTVAGLMFFKQAHAPEVPDMSVIAYYSAFGAVYFLISALWLTVAEARTRD
ncbi:DUF308 domain-containing protein [Mycolicibacterium fluoranthenivorans]|uniref:DUF308 domain-containing protein n=1 Tax=Mycolicibacterium fluoranthenivorans TaxID=258505 RepID=A0A1G4WQY0_9MYCO|nr:DUF308 domain-containing protein [Mycolicibacterium fluoranthenivorans]SCX27691.1 Short repeat of unknown function [Mycolicibacterium fluoranthenivorans]